MTKQRTNERSSLLGEVVVEWLKWKELTLKPSSYMKYYKLIHNHIVPDVGDVELARVDAEFVASYLRRKSEGGLLSGEGMSGSSVQSLLYIIKAAFRRRLGSGALDKIPLSYGARQEKKMDSLVLTRAQQESLRRIVQQDMDPSKLGILICLNTGLRIGEICSLQWKDVDFNFSCLSVTKTVQRINVNGRGGKTKLVIASPKSASSIRKIPIPSFLHGLMLDFYKQHRMSSEQYVISFRPNKLTEPRTYFNRYQAYLKQADIPKCKFHILRHTFATNCVRLGFDVKTLSEILGHSNVNVTLQRYVHSSFESKREQMELLSQYMDN